MTQLPPQTALITGASSGIGLAFAKLLGARGYTILAVADNAEKLSSAAAALEQAGVKVTTLVQDLSQPAAAETVSRFVEQHQIQVDVLINCAGFATAGPFAHTNYAQEAAEMQLNMVALTQLTKLLLPAMIKRRHGRILNIASMAAFQPGPFMAVYYATKAYVLHLSEALAIELAGSGVTVSALCPGPTATNFAQRAGLGKSRLFNRPLPSPEQVAQVGYTGLMRGQRVIIPGWRNRLMVTLGRLAPRSLVLRYVARLQKIE